MITPCDAGQWILWYYCVSFEVGAKGFRCNNETMVSFVNGRKMWRKMHKGSHMSRQKMNVNLLQKISEQSELNKAIVLLQINYY